MVQGEGQEVEAEGTRWVLPSSVAELGLSSLQVVVVGMSKGYRTEMKGLKTQTAVKPVTTLIAYYIEKPRTLWEWRNSAKPARDTGLTNHSKCHGRKKILSLFTVHLIITPWEGEGEREEGRVVLTCPNICCGGD